MRHSNPASESIIMQRFRRLGILVLVMLTQVMLSQATHAGPPEPDAVNNHPYELELSADGSLVQLKGAIDFGLTRDLTALLEQQALIRTIQLESGGGRVAEGRGIAMLINRYGLATYTRGNCLSACTLAYMSGVQRSLGPNARLGFHSYRLNSPLVALFLDPEEEMRKDMARFEGRNIEPTFLERIAATPHSDMWYPSHAELLAANVVHEILATADRHERIGTAPATP